VQWIRVVIVHEPIRQAYECCTTNWTTLRSSPLSLMPAASRAAAKLGKSQSALSQSVRRLEERLKLRLLTRTTRSVMPTPAGEQLLSTLRPALGEIVAQLDALSELRELPSGSLRLTAGRHAAETVLWPAVLRLNKC
jgi:DNA-binding transcriptional LysR family regulator